MHAVLALGFGLLQTADTASAVDESMRTAGAFCVLAFVGIMIVVVRALMFGDPTSGWPSLVCIILLCSGVQLLCTGIAGEYLAKTYLETKHRPIYIAAETEEDLDAE